MADLNVNLDDVEASAPAGELIPPGLWVKAEVVKSDVIKTASGGEMLTLEWSILEGSYKNRRIWDNQNFINANPKAQDIARKNLKTMQVIAGVPSLHKSEFLHNKPMMIKTGVQEGKNGYAAKNNVTGYAAVGAAKPSTAAPSFVGGGQTSAAPIQAADAPAQPAKASAPWRKVG